MGLSELEPIMVSVYRNFVLEGGGLSLTFCMAAGAVHSRYCRSALCCG